jgi:hypothetical protein
MREQLRAQQHYTSFKGDAWLNNIRVARVKGARSEVISDMPVITEL